MSYAGTYFRELIPATTRDGEEPVDPIAVDAYPSRDKRRTPVVFITQQDTASIDGVDKVFDAVILIAGDRIEALRDCLNRVIEESKA